MVYLLLTFGSFAFLVMLDMAWRKAGSFALLVPGVWLAIQGSRPVSYWVGPGGGGSESHPANTITFAVLMFSAFVILAANKLNWGTLIAQNKFLFLIYGYLLVSFVWSDIPMDSLRRLIKDFSCVMVSLVVLVQPDPFEAIRRIVVRISYLLFPLSVVLIKYFPRFGRQRSHSDENMFTGVTTQKNSLGLMVFVFTLFIVWDLFEVYRDKTRPGRTLQLAIRFYLLLTGAWLLVTSDSKTSLLCLVLGLGILWCSNRLIRMRNGKSVLMALFAIAVSLVALDRSFGLSEIVFKALGRNPTLTGRTDIWQTVLDQKTDPIFGQGFCVFWDTGKGTEVIDELMRINSAHNGYLEMYVDGGIIGVSLLLLMLLAAGVRVINRTFNREQSDWGRLGLTFWLLSLIYNFSETSYFRLDVLWFTLLLVTIEVPRSIAAPQWTAGAYPHEGVIQP